jgi:hypothetical protein
MDITAIAQTGHRGFNPGGGVELAGKPAVRPSATASLRLRPRRVSPRFGRIAFNVGSSALAAYLRWNGAETESFAGTREKSAN